MGDRATFFATGSLVAVHKLPVDLALLLEMGALWFGLVRQLGPQWVAGTVKRKRVR